MEEQLKTFPKLDKYFLTTDNDFLSQIQDDKKNPELQSSDFVNDTPDQSDPEIIVEKGTGSDENVSPTDVAECSSTDRNKFFY